MNHIHFLFTFSMLHVIIAHLAFLINEEGQDRLRLRNCHYYSAWQVVRQRAGRGGDGCRIIFTSFPAIQSID